ncbi:cupin domain-containing protein [Streptomyces sp. NBS 14/10]|uniref:cupin domain-containing protein n=1 Tax=Streptomyces sp. NBS 14/10 TaxID=1945643 RepID=UPI00118091FD|nr:cupin domain-containing protein [Streptomyces sp. NBS 14/10]KAK1178983.1 cupin domain-containing protein [Streptomyces sp. NBS 14/10]
MRLVNEHNAIDLRITPVHLGLGSTAKPVEGFAWDPEALQAYSAAVAADGAEGRMVMIFDGDGPGDHWESHPAGDELVVCLSGSVTVTRDLDGVPDRILLGPGEAICFLRSAARPRQLFGTARWPRAAGGLGRPGRRRGRRAG